MSNINLNNNSKRSRERREIDREHYKNNFFRNFLGSYKQGNYS